MNLPAHQFCIAPMLDWTDRHARYFLRLITEHSLLYTEMVTTGAIVHGDSERHLAFNEQEHPLALQLGGSNPDELATACDIAKSYHYDEINLNIGCPSDRVQSGRFGACLMADPTLVASCISRMQQHCDKPVTIKCRIGIDDFDSFEFLYNFIDTCQQAGCETFIIHARKAWLSGLSPKQNREIPELDYPRVWKIKQLFPHLNIIINGGFKTLDACQEQLQHVDGIMMGREAYNNPYILAEVDQRFFNSTKPVKSRLEILNAMLDYIDNECANGVKLNHMSRHILGLFNGQAGAKQFRRYISENAHKKGAGTDVITQALEKIPQ